jgi:hypothetical protein
MAVKLAAIRAGRALLLRNIIILLLVLIFVRGLVNPKVLARPEGLRTLEKVQCRNRESNPRFKITEFVDFVQHPVIEVSSF